MPWILDSNGNNTYKISAYAKEELPTWSEIYEEFYKKKLYNSYNELDKTLDPYWNIPHTKYLLMTVCNQFNKMINEDGYKDEILKMIKEEIDEEATDVIFLIRSDKDGDGIEYLDKYVYQNNYIPPIYTIPLPNGKDNPFIISKDKLRISSRDLSDNLWVFPLIISRKDPEYQTIYAPYQFGVPEIEKEFEDYNKIIEFMIRPFKEYFEGEAVGWKDKDGKIIESDPLQRSCSGVGYDPAL